MTYLSTERASSLLAGLLGLLLACAALSASSAASAQTEDATKAASARALFEEGVALADQGHWEEAADRFRRALALRDSAVIAYNLASALQETGKLVEASELLRRVQHDPAADAELHTSASHALVEVEKRIGKLTVHVQGQQSGDRLLLDERELVAAELDVALPIDPGAHVVRVQRREQVVAEQGVDVADGQVRDVSVQVAVAPVATPREVAVAAAPPKPAESARTEPDRDTPITGRWWFWAGIGTAAVGIGVAVALAASAGSDGAPEPTMGDFEPGVVGVEVGR